MSVYEIERTIKNNTCLDNQKILVLQIIVFENVFSAIQGFDVVRI